VEVILEVSIAIAISVFVVIGAGGITAVIPLPIIGYAIAILIHRRLSGVQIPPAVDIGLRVDEAAGSGLHVAYDAEIDAITAPRSGTGLGEYPL